MSDLRGLWAVDCWCCYTIQGKCHHMPLHCCLEITIGLLSWDMMWVGKERRDILWHPGWPNFFFFFCLELFTSSLYSLKEQRMVSWPLILSRSFGQKGPVHGNIIVAHTEKDRNRAHTRASKFPFRPLHAISFTFLNICSSFLSSAIKKSYMKLLLSRPCSTMLSRLSAVSIWVSPSLLYLTNNRTHLLILLQIKLLHLSLILLLQCSIPLQRKPSANRY